MYEWIKAFHIIALIAWMAGLLYLPRLFVYHCVAEAGSVQSETFKVMERRRLRAIINPAIIATWVLWLALAWLACHIADVEGVPFLAHEFQPIRRVRHDRIDLRQRRQQLPVVPLYQPVAVISHYHSRKLLP